MKIAAVAIGSALILASCDRSAPDKLRASPARAGLDVTTKVYGDCVSAAARTLPVADDTPGNVADRAIASCKVARAALLPRVRDFYLAGHKATVDYAANVAEASVAGLEDDIRTRAAIAVVERQNKGK